MSRFLSPGVCPDRHPAIRLAAYRRDFCVYRGADISDATKEALAAAIQAHVADEFEDASDILLTDWVLACAAVRMDPNAELDSTSYSWWSNGGNYHSMRGLVSLLGEWVIED